MSQLSWRAPVEPIFEPALPCPARSLPRRTSASRIRWSVMRVARHGAWACLQLAAAADAVTTATACATAMPPAAMDPHETASEILTSDPMSRNCALAFEGVSGGRSALFSRRADGYHAHMLVSPSLENAARTRVLRGATDGEPWELWQREPHALLRPMVFGLWAGLTTRAGACHRVLPNGEVMLMMHVGPTQRIVERDGAPAHDLLGAGFISGLQERPSTFESFARGTRVVAARLTPMGAWTLLHGVPQSELVHRVLALDSVLPARSGVGELRERMLDMPDLGGALELLEAWLLTRLQRAREPHAATQTANALLLRPHGLPSVAALARTCGVSARRLHELFQEQVGVSTKRILRIRRFRSALERMAHTPDAPLTEVALACGYYDQPHLYRDFRALASMTPVAYRAAVDEGLDGPDVIGS